MWLMARLAGPTGGLQPGNGEQRIVSRVAASSAWMARETVALRSTGLVLCVCRNRLLHWEVSYTRISLVGVARARRCSGRTRRRTWGKGFQVGQDHRAVGIPTTSAFPGSQQRVQDVMEQRSPGKRAVIFARHPLRVVSHRDQGDNAGYLTSRHLSRILIGLIDRQRFL